MTVRTRIAPSPTGQDLHIGNAYTALINYVVAKKAGGQFIIRIEDTDRTRLVEGSEHRILASLDWLGIPHHEGPDIGGRYAPYRQSDRLTSYRTHAETLVVSGHAYYCFCTAERLEEMRKAQEAEHKPPMYDGLCKSIDPEEAKKRVASGERHVIRMNVPDDGVTTFTDLIRGEVSFENVLIDDQVIIKSDNFPTYHLGVVVDDHEMKISHIIRGEEWISSTPKHILLYKFFGWDVPEIAHVSVLRNPDRSKLSKRKNPVWVSDYKAKGYLPEAILNYLASLAWSYPDGRDIFSVDEMIKVFDISQLKTSAPIFDVQKLNWMNNQYYMKKHPKDFAIFTSSASEYSGQIVNAFDLAESTAHLFQPRVHNILEYDAMAKFLYAPLTKEDYQQAINKDWINMIIEMIEHIPWNHTNIEEAIRAMGELKDINPRDLFMELRLALTGKKVGPPLLESIVALGRESAIKILKHSLEVAPKWEVPKG